MTDRVTLSDLATPPFATRHIGPSDADRAKMLEVVGYRSVAELVAAATPEAIRTGTPLDLPEPASEDQVLAELRAIASRNRVLTSMIGLGYYDTITPAVILRNVLENPGWYTAYTPYQPEISQGRLEALINFQTLVSDLTGLPVAGASLLDEATAAAEAMALARRAGKAKSQVFVVDADALPQTKAVLATRAEPLGITIVESDLTGELPECFGVLVQYPGASGRVAGFRELAERAHAAGAMVIAAADLLALTLLVPPGEQGADIAVGSTQRFGVPLGYGGPHAAYIAVRDGLQRQLPGRLVGVSKDADGRPAYRLALQTREQHIRREKATSNICTAQVLLAVVAAMYAVYHGPDGLRRIARRVHRHAAVLAAGLRALGVEVVHDRFFDTVLARVPGRAREVVAAAEEAGINLRLADDDHVGIACDEKTTAEHVRTVWRAFAGPDAEVPVPADLDLTTPDALPAELLRTSEFLTHPVFNSYHSETAMLRYLRRLMDKDLALDRSMIPLGSCTMKLNATTEMEPITWPEFAGIHPFAPADQARGYAELISSLEGWLAEITGYDKVSIQPNAGSQGELAGLLAIRGYHRARGEAQRDVCLIPSSAHGTNAASAAMAGMRVVVVACDADGNVDMADLAAKIEAHRDTLAAIMVTYPSTHGVFEETITEICARVHEAGGQVYVDGANLNALVGISRLGELGADVSHLNLHKTFAIPHGGGGPGVGPVAVKAHLAPHLPAHIAAAPYGSASILPISWAYIRMMGADGLRRATEQAILSANYLAARLRPHYPVLYTGRGGLVAHECIIDLRKITKETGITVDDVAKRLIDYGFHAPTMSFPVSGTLMIEPTESEDLTELDRFADAMIAIRREIDKVASGEYDRTDNPLKNAPHTAEHVAADEWPHPYSRAEAAYPVPGLRAAKYWPPVRRIDQAYGDRNLFCSCPPVEAYQD
ncbi:aminomethyl-transferring glycine dehydrogenase [Thermobispora bispora]|uniref:Glycine dehydrogenase (decarboxylating) n=1 Tax=Thermobispora bispora (strain ATCC 19993 / DSM 43833 / CBS 139.67 / JCM 10125 / KCTC 9307 / NBRC 14880 / R51) TaxID=469371 RepID=D6YB50_THEBD|nr:aminomethyl-transferring glycine dehydrogenase [Thermobispora bispora]MBO2475269.1 glycine dehydrogenase (aminomethyl-transferring) [Actinomycetales bacterium]MDI9580306.1 aminomethyl-transferring glycine dehydrogenase [Thermobispora sp.]ADG88410.1 glycine dehydrogenase [Thermobispora bispora DSM 43833]MBX6166813.1 aminomethyl-transferring glycine dehydrogenase [Thermobispora bispora]QSI48227.1 glycine dehydrogenase (aminomethyl-transferring) [Thermobispora bispora]